MKRGLQFSVFAVRSGGQNRPIAWHLEMPRTTGRNAVMARQIVKTNRFEPAIAHTSDTFNKTYTTQLRRPDGVQAQA